MLSEEKRQELYQQLGTSPQGLELEEVKSRLMKYGPNFLREKKRRSILLVFLGEFKDLMVLLLIAAAVIALIGGEKADAIVIFFIVILNAIIGFIQEFKAENAIEALRQLVAPKAKVIRQGLEQEIDAKGVVPGDIILLQEGDSIPADAHLIEVNELEVSESVLTGESMPKRKFLSDTALIPAGDIMEMKHRVFMGTMISHGNGKAIVIATGMHTEMGKIATLTTETKKDQSPLEKEFFRLGIFVGKVSIALSAILFAVGYYIQEKEFVETLLFAVSVAVAAVPEGLPATITIALAIGVQRLAKKNAIVKQLSSVETLGSTTVICSDKTGTLTKNEMTMEEIYSGGTTIAVKGAGYAPIGSIDIPRNHDMDALEKMLVAAGLCNNAKLVQDKNVWKVFGDPTEGALLSLVEKSPFKLKSLWGKYDKIHELSFDSFRKRMSVILREKTSGRYYIFTKGAPDSIFSVCNYIELAGNQSILTATKTREITASYDDMAKRALRTLGFAFRELSAAEIDGLLQDDESSFSVERFETKLTFLGLAGMIDPPRPEVKDAVALAERAGIRTYIITGDHGLTAEAIAKKLGIIGNNKHIIITGAELETITDKDLLENLQDHNLDIIFARVSPEDKLRIVSLLKESGEIVAVTGDGVNDAPALKRADIGIAMGITGTDVSKEAANMILTDDSYSTIVSAIKEGRTIYTNLKKFVFYVFSCNIGELVIIFSAIILGFPAPLTATLILCVDIGTDVLPAVALGIDPSEPGIMHKKPRDPKQRLMNKNMIVRFLSMGLLIGGIVMGAYFWTLTNYGWEWGAIVDDDSFMHIKGVSMAFAMLVIIQMVNAFNSRSEKHSLFTLGFFTNLPLLGAVVISLFFTIAILEIPLLQNYLHTTSLNTNEWAVAFGGSFLIFAIEEARKFVLRKRYGNNSGNNRHAKKQPI